MSGSCRRHQKSPPLPGSAIGGRTRGQPPPPGPGPGGLGPGAGRGRRFQRPLGRLGWPPRPSDSPGTQGRPWGRRGWSGVRPGACAVAGFAIRRFCLIGNQHATTRGDGAQHKDNTMTENLRRLRSRGGDTMVPSNLKNRDVQKPNTSEVTQRWHCGAY